MRRALACAVIALSACSKCGPTPNPAATGIERVIPANARVVVIVPKVEQLGEKLKILEGLKVASFVAQAQNFDSAQALADVLIAQLGIDVRSKEQLDKLGIARDASAAVALMDGPGAALIAIPIKTEGRVAAFLRTFATERLGASTVEDSTEHGVTVHRLTSAVGGARLAWVSTQGFALVTTGAGIVALSGWASRSEGETLAKDATLPASLARLPKGSDVVLYVPPGSKAILGSPVSHVVATLRVTPEAITVTADAPWGDASGLALFEAKAGANLLPLLPADAFAVVRFAGDPVLAAPYLKMVLGPQLSKALADSGLDLKADVLEKLAPGAVASLALAPNANIARGVPELDLRRTNPFSYVHLAGAAQAKSAEAIGPVLEKIVELAPKLGAQVAKQEHDGHPIYLTTYAQGEGVHFAQAGDKVFFASPLPRLDELLKADGKAPGPVTDPKLVALLEGSAVAMTIDLQKLAGAVRELPASAWGIGGFAIKATTLRWLDAADDLKHVTLTAGAKGGAVQVQLQLLLGKP